MPPVSNLMPPPPEMKIELSVPPPPVFHLEVPLPETPQEIKTTPQKPQSKKEPASAALPLSGDAIADEVGLVKPRARSKSPDGMRTDMDKILKNIKLPEKRSYVPDGERTVAPNAAAEGGKKLADILAANITENTTTSSTHASVPSAPSVVPVQNVFHEDLHVASVHTLKQDLQHVVLEQKMSIVKAVALEQEKKSRMDRVIEPPRAPSRAPAVIFTICIFVLLGLGALGGVYYIAALQSAPSQSSDTASLVFAEQTVPFPLTRDAPQSLRAQLALARTSSGTLGSLLHIVPMVNTTDLDGKNIQRPATLQEFFTALNIEPPESLLRAVGNDFFLGIHTVDKNAPILVIKVTSYDRAFDGMLSWEKNMNGDLAPLFTSVPRLQMGRDGLQAQRQFSDLVMRNYDVRALKDDDGVIQLYYSFPTRDLLIIAESPYTFTEILSRLQAGRRL